MGGGSIFFPSLLASLSPRHARRFFAGLTLRGRTEAGKRVVAEWPRVPAVPFYNWLNPRPSRRPAGGTYAHLFTLYLYSNTRTGFTRIYGETYERRSRTRTHAREFKYTRALFATAAAAAASANPPASRKIYIHRAPRPSPRPPPVYKRAAAPATAAATRPPTQSRS